MKKYVIITNDRGTVVEANCYKYTDSGSFLGRSEHNRVDIPFTPKRRDKLRYHENVVSKEAYQRAAEYFQALMDLEAEGLLFSMDNDLY